MFVCADSYQHQLLLYLHVFCVYTYCINCQFLCQTWTQHYCNEQLFIQQFTLYK